MNLFGDVKMVNFTPDVIRKIQKDFSSGKQISSMNNEQRRIVENFRPTRQEINEAYAKAVKMGKTNG